MTRAATSAALVRGYALVTLPATSGHDVWSNVALDGTVVINPQKDDPIVSELVRQGLPVVSAGRPADVLPVTAWVDNDHGAAVLSILNHLADAGARRIGLLTGTSTDTYLQRIHRLRRHRTARHHPLAQTTPHRHRRRPAPHRRHRRGGIGPNGRAGDTDRTHRAWVIPTLTGPLRDAVMTPRVGGQSGGGFTARLSA